MSSTKSGSSQVAIRYAKALFDLAKEDDINAVEKDLLALEALLTQSESINILVNSPVISRAEKEKAFLAVLEKIGSQKITRNFISVLARNNRLPYAQEIIAAFISRLMAERGEVVAEVISAAPVQGEYLASISKALAEALGKKVKINVTVDKKLLGGLIVKVGSVMLDNSLKSKLDRLEQVGEGVTLLHAA